MHVGYPKLPTYVTIRVFKFSGEQAIHALIIYVLSSL
jgi:hypothetical protein